METKRVLIENGEVSISGTIDYPINSTERFPAVLILSGSGPLDRDGNGKGKQKFQLYNSLSEAFVECGCATLRYDKRGVGETTGNYHEAGVWDLISDARAAYNFLKNQPNIDQNRIVVIGHSEGAMLAPSVIKGQEAAGLILLAGAAETLAEALAYQRHQVISDMQEIRGIKGKLVKLFNVPKRIQKQEGKFDQKVMSTDQPTIRFQGIKLNAKWFREHYQFDVRESLRTVTCPTLAVTGEKDVQVTPERVLDVKNYVSGPVEAKIIPNMNHMLRIQHEDYSILKLKKAYQHVGKEPLAPALKDTLKEWLIKYV